MGRKMADWQLLMTSREKQPTATLLERGYNFTLGFVHSFETCAKLKLFDFFFLSVALFSSLAGNVGRLGLNNSR